MNRAKITNNCSTVYAEFISTISRGGITKPSNIVFMACILLWSLYEEKKLEQF